MEARVINEGESWQPFLEDKQELKEKVNNVDHNRTIELEQIFKKNKLPYPVVIVDEFNDWLQDINGIKMKTYYFLPPFKENSLVKRKVGFLISDDYYTDVQKAIEYGTQEIYEFILRRLELL